jgi:spore coat protein H
MRSIYWPIAIAVPFFGCADHGSVSTRADGGGDGGGDGSMVAATCAVHDPSLATADTNDLFGAPAVPTFEFYLPSASWEWLKAHAREEIYVEADACYNGKGIGRVGLRFKGSYGSLYNCFNAAGENTCRKLGMKAKFDEYVDKQRFHGLKRLNFQGYRYDDSYLKERLSYDLYRAMGIVSPRAAWAKLRVNGEEQGLFGMVEQIDGPFAKNRFPANPDGNIYKESWPGQGNEAFLISRLETNTSKPDVAAYQAFTDQLNAAAEGEARAVLAKYMDLNYLARYMAVDDAIANFDGITTYYTNGTLDEVGNHNFFIYEEGPQKFTMIPWDLESTLSLSSNYGNVPAWQTLPADCTQQYPVWGGQNKVIAPGCDRVFRAIASDLAEYKAAARTLLDTAFTPANMESNIATLAAFIRDQATADPHGPGKDGFEKGIGFIRQDIPRLRARLEHLLAGTKSVPLTFSSTAKNDFESMDSYGLIAGTGQMSNANTTSSVELNTETPLSGAKSCRIVFSFGNETTIYQQWMSYQVPMATIPTDATALTGVRLLIRSNVARVVRMDMDSPNNPDFMKGVRRGWDLAVDTTAKPLEVKFADAKTQGWGGVVNDSLPSILSTMAGLIFQPQCVGRDGSGQLPDGSRDTGWVDIDDVEFF